MDKQAARSIAFSLGLICDVFDRGVYKQTVPDYVRVLWLIAVQYFNILHLATMMCYISSRFS